MEPFNVTANTTVDLYTLDHRGTGRNNFLECQAAQAFAAGSPDGVNVNVTEIASCIKDIMFQIDNHTEALSVTSVAKDVEFLINTFNDKDTAVYVYGGSYGTYWAERVMRLAPKQVKGYKSDKYWKEYAMIPSHSSVMVVNGGLDFQTSSEDGTAEYEGLEGGDKILVDSETGTHCVGISLQTASDKSYCGFQIISSYVIGGDVSNVNTSCMNSLAAFDFADLKAINKVVEVTTANELYDSK